jgi:hypothetical protein
MRGVQVSKMAVSRRLIRLTVLGLLTKLPKTNPAFYEIMKGQESVVRKIVYFKRTEELMEL